MVVFQCLYSRSLSHKYHLFNLGVLIISIIIYMLLVILINSWLVQEFGFLCQWGFQWWSVREEWDSPILFLFLFFAEEKKKQGNLWQQAGKLNEVCFKIRMPWDVVKYLLWRYSKCTLLHFTEQSTARKYFIREVGLDLMRSLPTLMSLWFAISLYYVYSILSYVFLLSEFPSNIWTSIVFKMFWCGFCNCMRNGTTLYYDLGSVFFTKQLFLANALDFYFYFFVISSLLCRKLFANFWVPYSSWILFFLCLCMLLLLMTCISNLKCLEN